MLRDHSPVCPVCNVGVSWPNGWMDHDANVMEVGLGPGEIVLDRHPAPPATERGTAAPHFSGHVYCGQTIAHLSNC